MGLFGKIRDMLTYEDDSEEVEPVKKEVSTVSIPAPLPEKEKIDFEIEENEVKEELPKREERIKEEKPSFTIFTDSDFSDFKKEKVREEKKPYQSKEEVHKFKPSPIISPVYGIIKDEEEKEEPVSTFNRVQDVSLDDVRKKAYGTLEDDVETNLFTTRELSLENNTKNDIFDEVNNAVNERDKVNDDSDKAINENDLFNLIDSMYERKDD